LKAGATPVLEFAVFTFLAVTGADGDGAAQLAVHRILAGSGAHQGAQGIVALGHGLFDSATVVVARFSLGRAAIGDQAAPRQGAFDKPSIPVRARGEPFVQVFDVTAQGDNGRLARQQSGLGAGQGVLGDGDDTACGLDPLGAQSQQTAQGGDPIAAAHDAAAIS